MLSDRKDGWLAARLEDPGYGSLKQAGMHGGHPPLLFDPLRQRGGHVFVAGPEQDGFAASHGLH